ncbi:MAG: DNA polymerase III subunit gamma/tau [Eubacterium sp.]|nr:DNA polymerase III subunit gamma/tau [Eubacterium sp.]
MYQALYRKYRPKCFSDVYGQDHVVSTLKNEIKENRISHAYLFTGSRGTGKTSCAKILAKAVNCENTVDGEPCNECEICKGLDSGAIYDVVEIDAASNNGVDNIRELREEVNYSPSRGKYRVYIIDEVHMLSASAYNALLKTLEEPPAHVIFILATTEIHKIPATILSRCQRFDFKRIQPETMAVRLNQVAQAEGLELDGDASLLIARIADGALRDGLSILDQCASRSSKIDSALVSQVAGLTGRSVLYRITNAVIEKNSSQAMNIIAELYQNSYDMERLCVELINHYRNFLIAKTVKSSRELIVCTDDEYSTLVNAAKLLSMESIVYGLDLFQSALVRIKGGVNSRIEMEMSLIKLCEPKLEESMQAVLDRMSQLERQIATGETPKAVKVQTIEIPKEPEVEKESAVSEEPIEEKEEVISPPIEEKEEESLPEPDVSNDSQEELPEPEEQSQPEAPEQTETQSDTALQKTVEFDRWAEFLDVIHRTDVPLFGVLSTASGYVRGEHFLVDSTNPTVYQFIKIPTHSKAIKAALYEVTGKKYRLGIFKRKKEIAEKRDLLEDLVNQAQSDGIRVDIE